VVPGGKEGETNLVLDLRRMAVVYDGIVSSFTFSTKVWGFVGSGKFGGTESSCACRVPSARGVISYVTFYPSHVSVSVKLSEDAAATARFITRGVQTAAHNGSAANNSGAIAPHPLHPSA
jgi:hypothetical protein